MVCTGDSTLAIIIININNYYFGRENLEVKLMLLGVFIFAYTYKIECPLEMVKWITETI